MNLPDDLKNYRADDDAFQILTPDMCVVILCILLAFAVIFGDFF